jgi:nitrate reductase NapE
MSKINLTPSKSEVARSRADELFSFLFLTVVLAPFVAIAVVGGYGFIIWMMQLISGPPGGH